MKFWLGLFIILALFTTSITLLFCAQSPEHKIMGQWQEVSWDFERLDVDTKSLHQDFTTLQRQEVYKNLIIHDAEIWDFRPQNTLYLNAKDQKPTQLKWAIKGRGHVLQLKYQDKKTETYQVHLLNEDEMVVYFNFDLQIRGIVKVTFKKINKENYYAQKI